MTVSAELRAQVAEDRARTEEILRKRDDARRGVDIGEVKAGAVQLVSTRELVAGEDVTPAGHLAGTVTYTVFGWKTNNEEEDGLRRESSSPRGAAAAVRSMLDVGYCQIVISVVGDDGLVVFPDTP